MEKNQKISSLATLALALVLLVGATILSLVGVNHVLLSPLFAVSYFSLILALLYFRNTQGVAVCFVVVAALTPSLEMYCLADFSLKARDVLIDKNNAGFFSGFGHLGLTIASYLPLCIGARNLIKSYF